MSGFFKELKRRNVFKVAAIYAVTAWVIVQVVSIALPAFDAPAWVLRVFILLLLIGFPVALIMAWALELTPEGVRRAETTVGEKRIWTISIMFAVLAFAWYLFGAPAVRMGEPVLAETAATSPPVEQGASIAVLPFLDLSESKDQEYFALGMSEELLNVLAGIDNLAVASRTSAFAFKDSELSLGDIARKLGVNHVLEGSIRKSGSRLRITAQLIDTRTDRHLWSDTYDREISDVFALQDEIATAIVSELREPLGLQEVSAVVSVEADTRNIDAYQLFLEGRELFIQRKVESSITALEKAVELDPGFARAWEMLAAAYTVAPGWIPVDRDYFRLAEEAAQRGLSIRPDLSMAEAALANIHMSRLPLQPDKVFEHLDRALAIDPRNATAWLWRGLSKMALGYFEPAISDLEQCLAVEPLYENCRRHMAMAHYYLGNHELADELYVQTLQHQFGLDDMPEPIFMYLEFGNRAAASVIGNANLEYMGITHPDWLVLVEDQEADPVSRQALVEKLLPLTTNDNYAIAGQANLILAALGESEQITVANGNIPGVLFVWSYFKFPEYRDSDRAGADLEALGLADYWDRHGAPIQCRKQDNGKYHCEMK